jgi:hypothetical protein
MRSRHKIKLLGLSVLAVSAVMALSATAAQAKYLLLLNGKSVSSMKFKLEFLSISVKLENGLAIKCTGGVGSSKASLSESGAKLSGAPSATLTGCVWVASEKTCTINDEGAGQIKLQGTDLMHMTGTEFYLMGGGAGIGTIFTEGIFCSLPEEEEIGGTASFKVLNALSDTKVKTGDLGSPNLTIGNSKVSELTGEVHVSDADDSNATFGIHLVELP